MAKQKEVVGAALADRVEVQIHSRHDQSPDQAEVLVSGVRLAYVSLAAPHPVAFLSRQYLREAGIDKITAGDVRTIAAKAKAEAERIAGELAAAEGDVAQLLAGEPF